MQLNVSTDKGYLIAAGLRGPDAETGFMSGDSPIGFSLKMLFTARLRYMCAVHYIGAVSRSTKYTVFDIDEFSAFALEHLNDKGVLHYLSHMNRAFGALREDETWGEEACLLLTLADDLFYYLADPLDLGHRLEAQRIIEKLNK